MIGCDGCVLRQKKAPKESWLWSPKPVFLRTAHSHQGILFALTHDVTSIVPIVRKKRALGGYYFSIVIR